MIFDTHAHYDDEAFDADRTELLNRMRENGIGRIVNVGASLSSSRASLKLSEEFPFIYAAVGVHPSETEELNEDNFKWLEEICKTGSVKQGGRIVAVGETGLDYYWNDEDEPDKAVQKKWFERQIELAKQVRLPLIIHSREAAKDTWDIMNALHAEEAGGIIHCYSYSKEMAEQFLDRGFYFGIGGVLTFKNARKLKEVVEYLPMDKILLETDCPYLAPVPNRGKRNSSLNLCHVAEAVGAIKGISAGEVIAVTEENAKKIYGLT